VATDRAMKLNPNLEGSLVDYYDLVWRYRRHKKVV
jgi:hypothetical protein